MEELSLAASSHCFPLNNRSSDSVHVSRACSRCFRYFVWREGPHTCAQRLRFCAVCPRNIQQLFPCLLSMLSTDGLPELWQYLSHWHAIQRGSGVAATNNSAPTNLFSPLRFLISSASQSLTNGAKIQHKSCISVPYKSTVCASLSFLGTDDTAECESV